MTTEGGRLELALIGGITLVLSAAFVFGVTRAAREEPERVAGALRLGGTNVDVDVERATGHLVIRARDGAPLLDADLGVWVDGEIRALALRSSQLELVDRRTVEAHFPLLLPTGRAHAVLRLSLQAGSAAAAEVRRRGGLHEASASGSGRARRLARGERPNGGRRGSRYRRPHGLLRRRRPYRPSALRIRRRRGERRRHGSGRRAGPRAPRGRRPRHRRRVLPRRAVRRCGRGGRSPAPRAGGPALERREPHADRHRSRHRRHRAARCGRRVGFDVRLQRRTSGSGARLRHRDEGAGGVYGIGEESAPVVRVIAGADGRFAFSAPKTTTHWYAALDPSRTSPAVDYLPGAGFDMKLDVSPGGELVVRIEDDDTHDKLTARLIVHGIEGTLDPSFGPDYRATGAGPLIDAFGGEVVTPLPAGHYRVAATRGIEWSIDAQTVEILPGHQAKLVLRPRHVIPSPGEIDCDLHVHARPSFDSPVSPEDRIVSLVAAGIEFAVPTEHNLVGDYSGPLETLELTRQLGTVRGTEVTTYSPSWGHFGVFPLPKDALIPFRHTTMGALFSAARSSPGTTPDPDRVIVVHHPRLGNGLGYFGIAGFDPHGTAGDPRVPSTLRTDFDAVEVFNGYEMEPERLDPVMRDYFALLELGHYAATGSSDSHRIQYLWAGYPRTIVRPGAAAASGDDTDGDSLAVVHAIKQGRSFVTSGPFVELVVPSDSAGAADGKSAAPAFARPGDTAVVHGDSLRVHLTVRAAPWIDVTSLEIIAAGDTLVRVPIAPHAEALGPEEGTLAEAQARAVRFDEDLAVTLPARAHWLLAVVRGTRKLDDILPYMPMTPTAMTNPVYLDRR